MRTRLKKVGSDTQRLKILKIVGAPRDTLRHVMRQDASVFQDQNFSYYFAPYSLTYNGE